MRGELFEPGGCSAWPTSACAIATMRAAAELPAGAAAGATVPVAVVPGAPEGVPVAVAPVSEAVRSICAKSSEDGVAVVVVVVAGAAVAGAVGPTSSVLSSEIRAMAVSSLIPLPTSVTGAGALTPDVVNDDGRRDGRPSSSVGPLPQRARRLVCRCLTEQGQDRLRVLVGLREHARAGLLEDVVLGELHHLRRHVHVADPGLGRHQVLLVRREVVQRVLEAVLHRAELPAHRADVRDRGVDRRDRVRTVDVDRPDLGAEGRGRDRDDVAVVGADLERDRPAGAVEQLDAVEVGAVADALDLALELSSLGGDRRLVGRGECAVLELDGELTHALEHRVHLVQRTLGRLHEADGVLRVALGLRETADLTTKLLADGESSRVVGRTVDAVAGAQALHGLARTIARGGKLAVGVEGLDVAVDAKGHGVFSLMTVGVIRVVPGQLPVAPRTPSSDAPARALGSFWKKGTAGPRRTPRPHPRITSREKTRRRRGGPSPPFPVSTGPFPRGPDQALALTSGAATGPTAAPGWPARACSCRPAAGSGSSRTRPSRWPCPRRGSGSRTPSGSPGTSRGCSGCARGGSAPRRTSHAATRRSRSRRRSPRWRRSGRRRSCRSCRTASRCRPR